MRRAIIASVIAASVIGVADAQRGGSNEWRFYGGDAGSSNTRRSIRSARRMSGSCARRGDGARPTTRSRRRTPRRSRAPTRTRRSWRTACMYTFTGLGVIAAIDPGTGKTIWQFDPETWKAGRPTNLGFLHRGLSYWTDGTVERLFAGTHDAYLISVDAKTGKPDTAFGTGGRVDLTERLAFVERIRNYTVTSAPVVVRNVVDLRREDLRRTAAKGDACAAMSAASTRARASGCGRSNPCPSRASTGTIPGKATPPNTRATRTSGR